MERDDTVAKIAVAEKNLREDARLQMEMLAAKDKQIASLQKELEEAKRRLDEVVMTRKSEGTALLEIQHYKADNERLIAMLSQTKEFAHFGRLAQDSVSEGGVGIRYLDPLRQPTEDDKCHYPKPKDKLKSVFKDKNECEDWIPEEAYRLAHDFRNKCASSVSQSLMNQLLMDLNRVWRQREKKQLQSHKNEALREIQFLRRQLSFRQPYEKVVAEADIKRLKKEVKEA